MTNLHLRHEERNLRRRRKILSVHIVGNQPTKTRFPVPTNQLGINQPTAEVKPQNTPRLFGSAEGSSESRPNPKSRSCLRTRRSWATNWNEFVITKLPTNLFEEVDLCVDDNFQEVNFCVFFVQPWRFWADPKPNCNNPATVDGILVYGARFFLWFSSWIDTQKFFVESSCASWINPGAGTERRWKKTVPPAGKKKTAGTSTAENTWRFILSTIGQLNEKRSEWHLSAARCDLSLCFRLVSQMGQVVVATSYIFHPPCENNIALRLCFWLLDIAACNPWMTPQPKMLHLNEGPLLNTTSARMDAIVPKKSWLQKLRATTMPQSAKTNDLVAYQKIIKTSHPKITVSQEIVTYIKRVGGEVKQSRLWLNWKCCEGRTM